MPKEPIRLFVVIVAGLAFWELATIALGEQEAWDAPQYWQFYLAALGVCAVFGYIFEKWPARWGFIVMFAQLPVMMYHADSGPLWFVGLIFLTILTVPAMLVATATSYLRKPHRGA